AFVALIGFIFYLNILFEKPASASQLVIFILQQRDVVNSFLATFFPVFLRRSLFGKKNVVISFDNKFFVKG
ncbi:MAG: hypothetical protein KKA41_14645, partial [Proteobacteria bacterium]|nr:hypothetical protein [Pseudomonadota bacterium]